MQRIEKLTGNLLNLTLTDEEKKKEKQHYPYNYVERDGQTLIYQVFSNNNEDEEIDDLPNNITDIIINHIETFNGEERDKDTNFKIMNISKFYTENSPTQPNFLSTYIDLPGIRGTIEEIEYEDDKRLTIDYRYWPNEDGALLTIEDRYDTLYVDYNRIVRYLDPKINLDRVLQCLKNKVMN